MSDQRKFDILLIGAAIFAAAAVLGANFDPSEFLGAGFDLAVLFRSMAGFG